MVPAFVKADVKGLASNAEELAATEQSIKASSLSIETLTYALDVSNTKAVEAAFGKVQEHFGHADFFEIKDKGNYLLIRSFLRLLPSPDTSAAIVNISSWQAFVVVSPFGDYFTSKSILDNLATKAKFLNGRFIAGNWNVDDLMERKKEIVIDDLLKLTLKDNLGQVRSVIGRTSLLGLR
ncbi:hypothetical protein NX059_003000 [Plenodomus lindquistii]|nr:hypothetical protein NX059_003000 [Plenodomus lindquistii]